MGAAHDGRRDPAAVDANIDMAVVEHRNHRPSMLQDMDAGRRTEIDALCGAVADLAATHEVAVPLNATLAALIGVREFPMRVKCATLAWHTMKAALEGEKAEVTTE